MISATRIKYIQSLRQKKYRDRHGVFVAEGDKIVRELADSPMQIDMVCGLASWMEQNQDKLPEQAACITITEKELSRLSSLKTPNQVLAVIKKPDAGDLADREQEDLVLILDTLQDPGNLGTIIRTADWFGIRTIYCSPDTADVYNPKVIQSTMGSFIRVRLIYTDLTELLRQSGRNVYGAFLEGESVYDAKPGFPAALVVGNESGGISSEIEAFVNRKIFIPRHRAESKRDADTGSGKDPGSGKDSETDKGGDNGPESLNAAIATAIMMSWFRR